MGAMVNRKKGDSESYNVKDPAYDLVTHDLRGVFIKMIRVIELLREKLHSAGDPETKQLLSFLDSLSNQGVRMTDDILESYRLDQCDSLNLSVHSLNKIITEQGKLYRLMASDKKIAFTVLIPRRKIFCEIDRCRFTRLLDNLFNNALKFTPEKGKIIFALSAKGNLALIRVKDTGIGIPPGLHREIFKKYTHAKRPGTRNEKPTGLGLYIVKKIVELHRGKIWFESAVGKGTSFFVELERKMW